MAKIKGFLSQDVQVTRRTTPDSPLMTEGIPPDWIPLIEKIIRWYDNLQYPVMTPFGVWGKRRRRRVNRSNTVLPVIKDLWAGLDQATKDDWGEAADFVQRTGYQLFVKDTSYRIKNGLAYPRTPNILHQTHGLLMSNPLSESQVRLQRDDVVLTGPITLSFNYKKVEYSPTGGDPFKFVAQMWYMEGGEIKSETHTWTAPAGDVDWTSVSQTYGTDGRVYFHHRVTFYLDNYNADVYFANFLIQDKTLSWTVEYDGTTLPENASPAWSKTGGISTEKIRGSRLFLAEQAGSTNFVEYSRTPSFINEIGSTVKFRLKVKSGPAKDVPITGPGWSSSETTWSSPLDYWAGIEATQWADPNMEWSDDEAVWSRGYPYLARLIHSDGTHRVEYQFYTNGIVIVDGENTYRYHLDMRRYRTFRSFIKGDRLKFFYSKTLLVRLELTSSGTQEVTFGHYGRGGYDTESRWSFVKYYHGGEDEPGRDVVREGWWIKAGKEWEPDTLYRKQGWYFVPGYRLPYFDVVYLD